MFLAEKTVKNYVSNLLAKLGMERRTQAAVFGARIQPQPRARIADRDSGPSPLVAGAPTRDHGDMPFDEVSPGSTARSAWRCSRARTFGRVGVSVEALPAILPGHDRGDGRAVVFRTVPGTKLAYAAARLDPGRRGRRVRRRVGDGWSVLVRGVASELADDAATIARARELLAGLVDR